MGVLFASMKIGLLFVIASCASIAQCLFTATEKCVTPSDRYKFGIDGKRCPNFCMGCDHSDTHGWGTTCASTYDSNGCLTDRFCIPHGSDEKCPTMCNPRTDMKCHWGPTDEQGYCKRLSSDNDGNECSQQFCWPDCNDETETECWNGQDDNGCDKGSFCVKK